MAIFPHQGTYTPEGNGFVSFPDPVSPEALTEQATQSLHALNLSSTSAIRGTSVSLAIDLDEKAAAKQSADEDGPGIQRPRREPLRRDSLKRREALLKGKEGSRRRTRWENGRYHE